MFTQKNSKRNLLQNYAFIDILVCEKVENIHYNYIIYNKNNFLTKLRSANQTKTIYKRAFNRK